MPVQPSSSAARDGGNKGGLQRDAKWRGKSWSEILFNGSGEVRIGNWTPLDHLPSAGGPLLKASCAHIATQLKGSSLWKLPYHFPAGKQFFHAAVMCRMSLICRTLFASNLRFLSQLFSSSGLSKYSKSCDAEGENSALFLGMAH